MPDTIVEQITVTTFTMRANLLATLGCFEESFSSTLKSSFLQLTENPSVVVNNNEDASIRENLSSMFEGSSPETQSLKSVGLLIKHQPATLT
jgi:hypothetical protein